MLTYDCYGKCSEDGTGIFYLRSDADADKEVRDRKILELEGTIRKKDKTILHYEIDVIPELEREIAALKVNLRLLIGFIPDGWSVPLGWTQVVAQAQKELREADHA